MKILDNSFITGSAKQPIKKGTLQFLQDSHKETVADTLRALIGPTYNPLTFYVLYGCVNSGSGSNYNISEGAVFVLGEVFRVDANVFSTGVGQVPVFVTNNTQYTTDADPVTFTDSSVHNVHNIRKFTVAAGTSGSANYSAAVFGSFYDPFGVTSAWVLRASTADVTVVGGSGTSVNSSNIKYRIVGKTMDLIFDFQVNNTTAPTSFTLLLPASKQSNVGFATDVQVTIFDGATQVLGHAAVASAGTIITITPSALTNGSATRVRGNFTIEIA